jgi:hypothetical protein
MARDHFQTKNGHSFQTGAPQEPPYRQAMT